MSPEDVALDWGRLTAMPMIRAKLDAVESRPKVKALFATIEANPDAESSVDVVLLVDFGDGVPLSESDRTCDGCGLVTALPDGTGEAGLFILTIPARHDLHADRPMPDMIVTLGYCESCRANIIEQAAVRGEQ